MITLDADTARIILAMEEVCYGEGIGPDSDELIRAICREFPDVAQEDAFAHLPIVIECFNPNPTPPR